MSLVSCTFDQDSIMVASNTQCRGESQIDINGSMFASSIQCRDKSEDNERLRTVECLRGRLLAERDASRAAREETEQLSKKLDELEKGLNKEIKIRNRAEKRLRHALKKLESLNIINLSESSIGSISSYSSLGNDDSAQFSTNKDVKNSVISSKDCSSDSSIKGYSQEESSSFVGSEMSLNKEEEKHANGSNGSSKDCESELEFLCDVRQESFSAYTESEEREEKDQIENEENKLAIILSNNESKIEIRKEKPENVESVLLELKRVKEKLQYSINRRNISSMKEIYGQ